VNAIAAAAMRINARGENAYIGVHPRKGNGRRGNKGVAIIRTIFADFDGKHLSTTTPAEQVAEVHHRIAAARLPAPAIVVYSGHGVHVYWLFSEPTTDLEAWDYLIDALITTLGSDAGAKGGDRIMRLPGLVNWKQPVALAELVECDPSRRVEWEDLAEVVYRNLPEPAAVEGVERAVAAYAARPVNPGPSIIDTFNATIPVAEVLRAAGYDIVGNHFRRPGKADRGFSGILRPDKRGRIVSAHWSTNDPLNDLRFGGATAGIHDSFSAFTVFEHAGNAANAVKAAAELLNIPLPKATSDLAVLRDITNSIDGAAFADHFFAQPQTAESRLEMRHVLARFTTWPAQVDRILAMASGQAVAA
jgi:hypothetical protein